MNMVDVFQYRKYPAFAVLLIAALVFAAPRAGWPETYYWVNNSGDGLWSNPVNWDPAGTPGAGDDLIFDDREVGTTIANMNIAPGYIYVTNTIGRFDFQIPAGMTLSPSRLYAGWNVVAQEMPSLVISGGGTLNLTDGAWFYSGYRSDSWGIYETVISNITVNAENIYRLWVGVNATNPSGATGVLDMAHATLNAGSEPNTMRIIYPAASEAGLNVAGRMSSSYGKLILPPSLTNIDVDGRISLGIGNALHDVSLIDFGEDPQIKNISATYGFRQGYGSFIYTANGTTVTGFPPDVHIRVGRPDAYGDNLSLAAINTSTHVVNWSGFKGFECYVTNVYLSSVGGANTGNPIAELDLTHTNTTELKGCFTFTNVAFNILQLASSGSGRTTARLWLPSTVREINLGRLHLGTTHNGSFFDFSFIDLGTNSQLEVLTATNSLFIARGKFRYHNEVSGVHTGLPGTRVHLGVPDETRAELTVGWQQGSATAAGENHAVLTGVTEFHGYLSDVVVGYDVRTPAAGRICSGTIDLSGATNFSLDIEGDMIIATNRNGHGYVYLPPGEARIGGDLLVGAAGHGVGDNNLQGFLWLSNTVVSVDGEVRLGDPLSADTPGVISNYVAGVSGGLDLPGQSLVFTNGGRMTLNFAANPDPRMRGSYWGLRVKGDQRDWLAGFTNGASPRITIETDGLTDSFKEKMGIHYDAYRDFTYIGTPPTKGTVIYLK